MGEHFVYDAILGSSGFLGHRTWAGPEGGGRPRIYLIFYILSIYVHIHMIRLLYIYIYMLYSCVCMHMEVVFWEKGCAWVEIPVGK